jgi:replicative DNA helicase
MTDTRHPPWSEDAEHAVLGAVLIDERALLAALEILDDTCFYAERHRRMFRAMVTLAECGSKIDPLTLATELQRRGDLESAGGKDYIGLVMDSVPFATQYHRPCADRAREGAASPADRTHIVRDAARL